MQNVDLIAAKYANGHLITAKFANPDLIVAKCAYVEFEIFSFFTWCWYKKQ